MPAAQPTIIATSIGFQAATSYNFHVAAGPSYAYAVDLAQPAGTPRICILNQAIGEDNLFQAAAHQAFGTKGWISTHLNLTPMPNIVDYRSHLLAQDVIWVGGGSTANLLALWRLHGLDEILHECWQAGVVLKGVSAGSLCWHLGGTTDSFGLPLRPVTNGLGFLPYSNSPHYDAEEQRRPTIHRLLREGVLPDGYATDNGTGLVFFGTELHECITEVPGKQAYELRYDGTQVIETALPMRDLSVAG